MENAGFSLLCVSLVLFLVVLAFMLREQIASSDRYAEKFRQQSSRMDTIESQQSAIQLDHAKNFGAVLDAVRLTNNRLNAQSSTIDEMHSILVDLANRQQ